jgi:hypothetical protein
VNDERPGAGGKARRLPRGAPGPAGPDTGPVHGPAAPLLEELFSAKGLRPGGWWPFLVQGEGTRLPGGIEAISGFVLARDGAVYGWWLGWQAGRYTFERWWRVEAPERAFAADAEYALARRRLGLEASG